jgi:hypothetical protein
MVLWNYLARSSGHTLWSLLTSKNGVFWELCRVALVRTDVSEELSISFIRVTRIGELGTTLAITSNRRKLRRLRRLLVIASVVPSSPILVTLLKEALSSSGTLVLTRATRRNIPEDASLHSHRRENLKSYIFLRHLIVGTFHLLAGCCGQWCVVCSCWHGV